MAKIKGMNVLVYDLEVFARDYMAVFKDTESKEYYVYHNNLTTGQLIKNGKVIGEAPDAINLINDNWLCGYNNYGYDNMILTAMLSNPLPLNVKLRNDALFKHMKEVNDHNRANPKSRRFLDNKRFPSMRSIKSIDAMQEIVADEFKDGFHGLALKYIAANLGENIHETPISFDIKRKLTDEEVKLVIEYCVNDVEVTEKVMNARWDDYFETKMYLCDMLDKWSFEFSMTQRTTTLTAHLLENDNSYNFFGMLDDLYNRNLVPMVLYDYWKKGYVRDAEDDDGVILEEFNNEIKFKWGGLHGVHSTRRFFEGNIWHIDVASMYPSIIILLGILGPEVTKFYADLKEQRVKDKHAGLIALANGAKLILNKLYGVLGSERSKVSNITGLNAVCVYGQVAMYNLGKLVSPYGTIIQFNTDGIYFQPHEGVEKDFILNLIKTWEDQFKLEMDIDDYVSIAQRDVNTYVTVKPDGKYKTKGAISTAHESWPNMFKNWNASIVEKAVVELIVHGTPIHETVNNETDLRRFQYVTKITKAFRGIMNMTTGIEEEQKVNRFFVVNSGAALYKKVKVLSVEEPEKRLNKLNERIKDLEAQMPEYLADKETFETKKELNEKWKTGPEQKLKNAYSTKEALLKQINDIRNGEEVIILSKVTGLPEIEGRTLLYNECVNGEDVDDLLFKIDRSYYIDAALKLAGEFGVV